MAKERDMIESVDYDVGYPLSYRFLRRFGRVSWNQIIILLIDVYFTTWDYGNIILSFLEFQVCQVTMPVLTLARYILETSLMEYKFNVQLSESILAAATLALAMKVTPWKLIQFCPRAVKFFTNLILIF